MRPIISSNLATVFVFQAIAIAGIINFGPPPVRQDNAPKSRERLMPAPHNSSAQPDPMHQSLANHQKHGHVFVPQRIQMDFLPRQP